MKRRWTHGVMLVIGALAGGCGEPSVRPVVPPAIDKETQQYLARQYSYGECAESEAQTVLVFDLSIEGYLKSRRFEFPLKKERLYDDQGIPLPGPLFTMRGECADTIPKKNGKGAGHHLSVWPRGYENGFIRMQVVVSWTNPEGQQGKIDDQVLLPMGQDSQDTFRGRWSYKASFRPPNKPTATPAIQ